MTTKEIIFDSKNLPVNIDEVEWVLKGDFDIAYEALSNSEVRLRAIKNNTLCIGSDKLHADFNCIHCLADYAVLRNIEAMAKLTK